MALIRMDRSARSWVIPHRRLRSELVRQGCRRQGSRIPATVLIHVFIYGLPDKSEDALAVAQNDAVGAANLIYSRSLMMRHLGLANQQPARKK